MSDAAPPKPRLHHLSQEDLEARMRALEDLSDQEFQLWRHHPVTVVVRRWLDDLNASIQLECMDYFMEGTLTSHLESDRRGRLIMAQEIEALRRQGLLIFYGRALGLPDPVPEITDLKQFAT